MSKTFRIVLVTIFALFTASASFAYTVEDNTDKKENAKKEVVAKPAKDKQKVEKASKAASKADKKEPSKKEVVAAPAKDKQKIEKASKAAPKADKKEPSKKEVVAAPAKDKQKVEKAPKAAPKTEMKESSKKEVDAKPVESYIEQRGMIRRDATKALFIPKGQWMLGTQVGWQQWDNENLNYLLLKDISFQGHTFSVGPTLGYFFAKNMAVGARFSYKRNYFDVGGLGLNLGDDLTFSLSNFGYLQHNYKSTAFLRSYIPIGDSKIFGLFGEFQLNYTYSEGKNGTGVDEMFTGVYESVNSFGVGLGGGLVVFLTDFAAAEVMLNVGGCDIKWGQQNINNMEKGRINSSGANFRIDLFSIKFGLTFYL